MDAQAADPNDKAQSQKNKMIVKVQRTNEENVLPAKLGKSGVLNYLKDQKMVMAADVITYKENKKEGHITMEVCGTHKMTAETMAKIRSTGPQKTTGPLKWEISELQRSKLGVIKAIPQKDDPAEVQKFLKQNNPNIAEVRRMGNSTVYTVKFLTSHLPQEVKTAYGTRSVHMYAKVQKQCQTCLKIGHGKNNCPQKEKVCVICASDTHVAQNCTAGAPKCTNCEGDHKSTSPECPVLKKERENKKRKILSYAQMVTGDKNKKEIGKGDNTTNPDKNSKETIKVCKKDKPEETKKTVDEFGHLAQMIRQIVREELKSYFEHTPKKDQQTMTEPQPEPERKNTEDKEIQLPSHTDTTQTTQGTASTQSESYVSEGSLSVDPKEIAKIVKENLNKATPPKTRSAKTRAQSSPPCLKRKKSKAAGHKNKTK